MPVTVGIKPQTNNMFDTLPSIDRSGAFSPINLNNMTIDTANSTQRSQPVPRGVNSWVSGDQQTRGNNATLKTAGSISGANGNTVSAVKSVSGQLVCCVQGLLVRHAADEGRGSVPMANLTKLDGLCAEATLLPEGARKSTAAATVAQCAISASDVQSSTEWGGGSGTLSFNVAWALQQVNIAFYSTRSLV